MQAHVENRGDKVVEPRVTREALEFRDAINRGIGIRRELRRVRSELKHPVARVARAARHRALVLLEELVSLEVGIVGMDEARRAARGGAR